LATEEVSGKFKNQPREEFVDLSGAIDGSVPRITDFSNVGADLLRQLNRDFFEDSSFPYGYLRGSKHRTARRIENVKQYRIERLVREFPRTETLYQQCAHWVRAIVGLHFFPDANHRTAMSSLYTILTENGLTPTADRLTFDWIDVAVTRSKLLRAYHCDVTFSTLWQKDELYQHWLRYFRDNLVATHKESRNIVPSGFLDRVLEFSREERRNW
jgi:prophage maintenance system killer protein